MIKKRNILLLNQLPIDEKKSNLFRKFQSQIHCASKIFDRVFYTTYDDNYIYVKEFNTEYSCVIGKITTNTKNYRIVSKMVKYLKSWLGEIKIDYLYMRTSAPTVDYFATFSKLKKDGTRIIVEIPTYPGTREGANSSRKLHYFMNTMFYRLFGRAYRKNTSLYTLIGEKADSYKGVPAINIQNGLNIDDIPLKNGFENHPEQIHLLVVAVISYWHGYDRLLAGLGEYYHSDYSKEIHVHICGRSSDGSMEKLHDIVQEYHIEEYVHFDGYLGGQELIAMFDKCDIAVGSLGLFRQQIIVDTTLKIPEYTSRGIPFVYCSYSENINNNLGYCLKIPADESNVDINQIVKFYDAINKDSISTIMRKFAADNLDWSNQLLKVLKYFEGEKNNG